MDAEAEPTDPTVAVADLKTHFSREITGLAWKMATLMSTLLIAQGAAIVALMELLRP